MKLKCFYVFTVYEKGITIIWASCVFPFDCTFLHFSSPISFAIKRCRSSSSRIIKSCFSGKEEEQNLCAAINVSNLSALWPPLIDLIESSSSLLYNSFFDVCVPNFSTSATLKKSTKVFCFVVQCAKITSTKELFNTTPLT